jgi:hypothetical protein
MHRDFCKAEIHQSFMLPPLLENLAKRENVGRAHSWTSITGKEDYVQRVVILFQKELLIFD